MTTGPDTSSSRPLYLGSLSAGVGIGVLVGTLVGLSLSPVVGAFLGGLTALLAALLGLSDVRLPVPTGDSGEKKTGRDLRARDLRAFAFGIACTLGVLLGVTLRAQNLLGASVEDQYDAWKRVGFSDADARDLVRFKELGLVPEGLAKKAPAPAGPRPDLTALFANRVQVCESLEPERFKDSAETLRAWDLRREGHWREVASLIRESVPKDRQASFLETTWRLACDD